MNNIKEQVAALDAKLKEVRTLFKAYIKDQSVDLDERWDFFQLAPDYLRDTTTWIYHFEAFKPLKNGYRNEFEDDVFYADMPRYEVRSIFSYNEDLVTKYDNEELEDIIVWVGTNGVEFTKEIYDAWREEVLANNIGAITLDW